ncbi:MAG: choice-of-anchor I family protein [Burkholderiaceae bacterium]
MRLLPAIAVVAALAAAVLSACGDSTNLEVSPPSVVEPTPSSITLELAGRHTTGVYNAGGAEIPAYDPASRRLFVVNGSSGTVDVLNIANPAAPALVGTITSASIGSGLGGINSVAIANGIVALAVEASPKTNPGVVAFYRAADLTRLSTVPVGALPDMVAFTPDGRFALTANEAEPNSYGAADSVDPEGSVSIIDVSNIAAPTVRTAGFTAFNGQRDALRSAGVRIYGLPGRTIAGGPIVDPAGATVAQDLEPESITVSADGTRAWVTLQENNALAVIDIVSATVTQVLPLGFKDFSLAANALDASDRDLAPGFSAGAINFRNWRVLGMYQPDAIASYTVGGTTYLVTANEGDARDWPGLQEEVRVSTLALGGAALAQTGMAPCTDAGGAPVAVTANQCLGRLQVTNRTGLNSVTSTFDTLYAFGGRSFSIWNASTGALVWDSGDQLERRLAALYPQNFNASHTANTLDGRSTSKGPEPEAIAVQRFGSKTFAFIGLERIGGVMVYDITNPAAPSFVSYANSRNFAVTPGAATIPGAAGNPATNTGDLGPEGILVIPAAQSPTNAPLLVVANEISGTTSIFRIVLQ